MTGMLGRRLSPFLTLEKIASEWEKWKPTFEREGLLDGAKEEVLMKIFYSGFHSGAGHMATLISPLAEVAALGFVAAVAEMDDSISGDPFGVDE